MMRMLQLALGKNLGKTWLCMNPAFALVFALGKLI